jgi:pimeloyl-ACP methyl ester carboxylesterase
MHRIWMCVAVLYLGIAISPARAEEAYIQSNGVKIRYLTAGRGAAVILLHGFAVRSSEDMWIKNALNEPQVVRELARDYRVIAIDLRGHGKSGKPLGAQHYGVEMVDDVVRLMDHLQIKQAHVVGYSLGAAIVGKLLVTYPERLLSATLGGGAPIYQPSRQRAEALEEVAASLSRGAGAGPLVGLISPATGPRPPREAMQALGQLLVLGQDQKVLASVIRGIGDLEVSTEQLQGNKVPVLLVYGNREGEALERIEQVVQILARHEVQIIDGGDHMTTFARPEFRAAIVKFLKSQRQ